MPGPQARLRARLDVGERVVGTFAKLPGLEPIDCLAGSGLDFAVLDLEHSQLGAHEARRQLAYAHALGFPCLVRMPDLDAGAIGRYLEAGACGIQLANVRSRATAEALVRCARFPPEGDRGVSTSHRGAGYGRTPLADYLNGPEARPLLVIQVESADAVKSIGGLLASGVDVVFVGVVDLSVSLGCPGDLASPALARCLQKVADAAAAHGVAFGHHVLAPLEPAGGAVYVTTGTDLTALAAGLDRLADGIQAERPAG